MIARYSFDLCISLKLRTFAQNLIFTMKKIKYILLTFLLALSVAGNAEGLYTYGEAIDFQSGFVGSLWHPFLKYSQYDSNDGRDEHLDLLTVIMKTSDTYHSFPAESKLLLKFSDDSIVELESFGDVIKDYQCTHIGKVLTDIYYTGRNYVITEEALQKLLTLPIIKVRIELGNGNRKDYEVGEKHGKKVLKKLQKSHEAVQSKQGQRIKNSNSDLKDDF